MFFHLAINTGIRISKIIRHWIVVVASACLFGYVDWTRWISGHKNKNLQVTGSVIGEFITASEHAISIKVPIYTYDHTSKDPTSVRWIGVLPKMSQEHTG